MLISALKIIFLLGFLILIHEFGHFSVARLCGITVKEFSIGFGPTIFKKQGKTTTYYLKAIPLGGYVNILGEEENVQDEGSFSTAPIWKRILIVMAGGLVNIIFALVTYFLLVFVILHSAKTPNSLQLSISAVWSFIYQVYESLKLLFTGGVGINQFVGPVGISEMVVSTAGLKEYIYLLAVVSLSLGVTNLLPFPPLDGGKIVLLLIEKIIRKPLSQKFQINVQLIGFVALIMLSLCVTFNDIMRII